MDRQMDQWMDLPRRKHEGYAEYDANGMRLREISRRARKMRARERRAGKR